MLPCRSAAIPSGCGAPCGSVANRSTSPRSQADAWSDHSEQTNTPKTRRNKADIRTSSSQRCGTELSPYIAYSQAKRKGGPEAAFSVRQRTVSYLSGISCASSAPLLLSSVTTNSPSAGFLPASALFPVTFRVPVAPGATLTKSPVLTELAQTLNFATPGTALDPPFSKSKPTI